jgi:hypothetical protein
MLRVIERAEGPRPDDRLGDNLLVQQPGQRHVGRLLAQSAAQVLVDRDLGKATLHCRIKLHWIKAAPLRSAAPGVSPSLWPWRPRSAHAGPAQRIT